MSRVTEIAEHEAEQHEGEPDTEPTPDAPVEPTPEEQEEEHEHEQQTDAPAEEVNSDAQSKAVVSELRRHERAWAKLNGMEPEDLHVCPTCEGVGFTMQPQPKIAEAAYTTRCGTCNGYGEVLSGSLRPGNETVRCLACDGLGYEDTREAAQLTQNGEQLVEIAAASIVDPEVQRLREKGYTIIEPFTATATG